MKIKKEMKDKLNILGFKDVSKDDYNAICSYYEKDFGAAVIRIGDLYDYYNTDITFWEYKDYTQTEGERIFEYIPQWAFTTLMKLNIM